MLTTTLKVYGPYTRKDGRKHVVIVNSNGSKTTKSYPRYLMEQHLGRTLDSSETIDHINNDFSDDRIENLQILSLADNAKKEMSRPERAKKFYDFICPCCGAQASKQLNQVTMNLKRGKAGPFCSRKCAGTMQHKV